MHVPQGAAGGWETDMDANVAFAQMFDASEGETNVDRVEAGQDLIDWMRGGGFLPERLDIWFGGNRAEAIRYVETYVSTLRGL